jgi:cytochrome P450
MEDVKTEYRMPGHVPQELFVPGNIWEDMGPDPHQRMRDIAAGRDIVYLQSHNHQGHSPDGTWLACSAEACRTILMDTEAFPSSGATIFGKILGGLVFFPVEVEPPEHSKYRRLMTPFFKPAAVNALADMITLRVDELLDPIVAKGECEFVSEFARILPATIFLDLMGLPQDRAHEFLDWAREAMDQSTSADDKVAAMCRIRDYLAGELAARKERPQDDTLLSALALGEIDGRPLDLNESVGGAMVLFLAGLDTVANVLAWLFYRLAYDTELQAEMRSNPERNSKILEELLRYYSPVTVSRRAAKDSVVCGAPIKAGDTVCCSMTLASRDDKEFENPDLFDINQPPRRHLVFGYGVHMCLGMYLARLEAKIVLERWFARTSEFRLNGPTPTRGAGVLSIENLPLALSR